MRIRAATASLCSSGSSSIPWHSAQTLGRSSAAPSTSRPQPLPQSTKVSPFCGSAASRRLPKKSRSNSP
eukprot:scaffold19403_cov66-Phaeocystis_antarctica.AAC.1